MVRLESLQDSRPSPSRWAAPQDSVDTREDAGVASAQPGTSAGCGSTMVEAHAEDAKRDHQHGGGAFGMEPSVSEQAVMRKVDWHVLPFLCGLSLMCALDRANLSYAALQLMDDLQFSHTVYGLGAGMFFLGYMVFQVPSPIVCARLGAPRFLGSILALWGFVASLFAWMRTSTQFYALRFILGLAESGAYPGAWYYLLLFYTERELGLAYTTMNIANCIAGIIGGPIAALLLSLDGLWGLHGWQWLFMLEGVPAVALGVAIAALLACDASTAAFLTPAERTWLVARNEELRQQGRAEQVLARQGMPGAADTEKPFWKSWHIWYLCVVWLLVVAAQDAIMMWAPLLIRDIMDARPTGVEGPSAEATEQGKAIALGPVVQAALLSAIPFGLATVCMVVNAYLAKRADERPWHCALPTVVAAVALGSLPLFMGRTTWAAFLALSVATAGVWSTCGPLMSWPAGMLSGTNAASGFALMKMVGAFGSFLGPSLVGVLSDASGGSYTAAMLVLTSLLLIAFVMQLLFQEPGGRQTWLPAFPYARPADQLVKRSRSDPDTVLLAPQLRSMLSSRKFNRHPFWQMAKVCPPIHGHQQPPTHEDPAAHLLGEALWERHALAPDPC